MQVTVTLIIPIFNSSQTLAQTLSSVFSEINYSKNIDWQVIAIDDGSTDDSLEILKSWQANLPIRIESLTHTGSPATPRNLGIELSDTKYVFFLDADDVLLPGGLTAVIELAEKNDSDVVVARLSSLDGRGVPRGMFSETRDNVTLSDSRIYWSLNPMKLIKRSLLDDEAIRFDSSLRRDEDQPFVLKAYLAAKTISILADPPVVGVRYSPTGNNLTLRDYAPEDLFSYLSVMTKIMDDANLDTKTKQFLLIRNWEIEIAREFIWKRLSLLPESEWVASLEKLNEFSSTRLVPKMLPATSIRWRGIVGLIGTKQNKKLIALLLARRRVLSATNPMGKLRGVVASNWIRLIATIKLPKNF